MSDPRDPRDGKGSASAGLGPSEPPHKWLLWSAVLVLLVGLGAYVLIANGGEEEKWGQRGDAVGPFAAILNALALLALLHSLRLQRDALDAQRKELALQRKELELQRKEFADSREVMKEQAAQAERTARAQEELARSQARLANEQRIANFQHLRSMEAQYTGSLARLTAARASFTATAALARATAVPREKELKELRAAEESLRESTEQQEQLLAMVRARIQDVGPDLPDEDMEERK